EDSHQSNLDRLRQAPTRVSGPALIKAVERVKEIRAIGVENINLSVIPQNRLRSLARYSTCASAQTISRMAENRKIATLLAFSSVFSTTAMDDALEVFDLLITKIRSDAEKNGKKNRLRTIGDLDSAALKLLKVCDIVLDETCPTGEVKQRALEHVPREQLFSATKTVVELARPPGHNYRKEFVDSYRRVRLFLPTLLDNVCFDAAPAGRDTLKAIQFLASIEGQRKPNMFKAPLEIVSSVWKSLVVGSDGIIDRQAYTLSVLERLQNDLRRRDIFVTDSDRWSDPRSKLLAGERWLAVKAQVCRAVGRQEVPEDELLVLAQELDETYRRIAANLPTKDDICIDRSSGKDTLTITNLDRIEEPESLVALRETVKAMLPIVDLPQMLLEIHARTGFVNHFTHGSEGEARVEKLSVSICAVLLAEACNFGIEPLVREDVPALTRSRLLWVQQNYIRAETLSAANAVLVDAQTQIPLVKIWGGGEVASADGLRFVVPVRTVNARPNPKYFKSKRGITWYELTSDQYTGLNGIVIPGTLRDSMYILEVLLGQETSLNPREIMTDTAGASDVVFALFWLLGYRFSPRLADAGASRFWRMDPKADYGILNGLARQTINTKLISRNWEDILRIMGSLLYGTIMPSELIQSLLRGKRPSTLTRAIQELGRIQRTLYLLNYVDDPDYRRRILTQLNRGEERWGVARTICFARRGEIRKRYREGQEDQLGALGLVLNASVLWQTLYMNQAVQTLRAQGRELRSEDITRLSPLVHSNLNVLGRYSFDLSPEVKRGNFRPLRQLK
ncbi:MAG: transposase, partial [Desulfobacterales bacterium S5133MH4]